MTYMGPDEPSRAEVEMSFGGQDCEVTLAQNDEYSSRQAAGCSEQIVSPVQKSTRVT